VLFCTMADNSPIYVFRGTTLGFPGGGNSLRVPYTCTTANPAKAVLFALEVARQYEQPAVIYIARIEVLNQVPVRQLPGNVFEGFEEEYAWEILPSDFYKLCEGYVKLSEMQDALSRIGIPLYRLVFLDNINTHCKEITPLDTETIKSLVDNIGNLIKKT
jgi:hypothetical protein